MPLSNEKIDQIRKDAKEEYPTDTDSGYESQIGYLTGATAEAEKALYLIEALEYYQESEDDKATAALQSYTKK